MNETNDAYVRGVRLTVVTWGLEFRLPYGRPTGTWGELCNAE